MKNTIVIALATTVLSFIAIGCSTPYVIPEYTVGDRVTITQKAPKPFDSTVIPSGEYRAELDENYVKVTWPAHDKWPEGFELKFVTSPEGQATNLLWEGGSWDMGTRFCYRYPFATLPPGVADEGKPFPNISDWKKFADKVCQGPIAVSTNTTIMGTYTYTGHSATHYKFTNSVVQLNMVPIERWVGTPPTEGSEITIAISGNLFDRYFVGIYKSRHAENTASLIPKR